MASGSILGNVDEKLQCKVEWSSTSNGSQANTSKIRATVYARRTDNFETKGRSWSGYVAIGGEHTEISFSSSVAVSSSWIEMASMERTVSHNSDGTKQIAIEGEVSGPSGTSLSENTSYATEDVWLDRIPRYATGVSISLASKSITSATFNWSANENCNKIKYGKNESEMQEVSVNAKNGTFTITGLTANTTFNIFFNAKRADSNLYLQSNIKSSVTTYNRSSIIGYTKEFNIGNNVSIQYDNPSRSSKVKFKVYTYSPIQKVYESEYLSASGGKFTWNTTSILYPYTPNNNSLKLYFNLVTETDMGNYTDTLEVTAKVVNSNPTFSNFTYEDTNGTTKALTGSTVNNPILVNGYSNVTATISTTNKAIRKNSATMTSYTMSIGSQSTNPVPYSESSQVQLSLPKVNSGIVIISAKDSRGNSTTVQKGNNSSLFKNYTDLVIKSVTATRSNNGVGKVVTLSYNGTFWNASFGKTTNTIKTLKYYYKLTTASSWTTGGTTLTKTVSGNNWSGSIAINGDLGTEGFDISNAYNIRLQVSDELSTKTFDLTLTSGTPAMSIYKNKIAIGKQYNTSQGGILQVGGISRIDGDNVVSGRSYLGQKVRNSQGTYVENFNAGHGTSGYIKICTLRIGGTYQNQPIIFGVIQRTRYGRIILQFVSSADTKPSGLTIFQSSGNINPYMVKTGDSTWDLYIQKSEAYDQIEITELFKGEYQNAITITWKNEIATSLPSGYVSAEREYYSINVNHSDSSNTATTATTATTANDLSDTYSYTHSGVREEDWGSTWLRTHSFIGSLNNNGWRSIINVRHRGGASDGNHYGLQIIDTAMTSSTWEFLVRKQYNGTWTNWESIPRRVNLYNNSSGNFGTITLSQSANNFNYIEIYFKNNDGNETSTKIYRPNTGTNQIDLTSFRKVDDMIYLKHRTISINGTSITSISNADCWGSFEVGSTGAVIGITRVDGYK